MGYQLTLETISWERVTLSLVFRLTVDPGSLEAEPQEAPASAIPRVESIYFQEGQSTVPNVEFSQTGDLISLGFNVTNFADRMFIPMGAWQIWGTTSAGEVPARVSLDRLDELESYTRAFLFNQDKEVFTVQFGITDDAEPQLVLRAYGFSRDVKEPGKAGSTVNRVGKAVFGATQRQRLAKRLYAATRRAHLLKRRAARKYRPRILFASETRKHLEGNLLAIRDQMVARGLDEVFEFRYSFRLQQQVTPVDFVRLTTEIARADYVLVDDYFGILEFLDIDETTKVIQVWHAGVGFKSVGYSRFGKFGSPKGVNNSHRTYTYAITGSAKLKPVYAEAFGIEEEAIVPTGLPRIDAFLDRGRQLEAREAVYKKYPLLRGKRVILFAPTFRGLGIKDAHYDFNRIDMDALYALAGEDSVIAFRMHQFVPDSVPIRAQHADRLVDVGDFRDVNAILLVADIMITDYSSIIYEYSLLRRPMLFYAFDKDVYSATRGFHQDYVEAAPGKVVASFDELVTALRDEDFELEKVDAFRDRNFDYFDSNSSNRVIDWLILGPQPAGLAQSEGSDS